MHHTEVTEVTKVLQQSLASSVAAIQPLTLERAQMTLLFPKSFVTSVTSV